MDHITKLFWALWHQDYIVLSEPGVLWLIYGMLIIIIFFENGLLLTAFLPGDSLLFLTGTLIASGSLHFALTILLLTFASYMGGWFSFLQGRWLGKTTLIRRWLTHFPQKYHQQAETLFNKHGLIALLIARFIAFVRTLFPVVVGLSKLNSRRFHLFNLFSSLLWVSSITTLGYLFASTSLFKQYQHKIMSLLTLLPIVLLVIGFCGVIFTVWQRRNKNHK